MVFGHNCCFSYQTQVSEKVVSQCPVSALGRNPQRECSALFGIHHHTDRSLELCMSVSVQVSVCCTSCVCVCFSETSCVQIMLDSDLSLSDPLSYCTYGVITLYKSHNTACVHSVMYLYVHFVGSCYALHADCTAARLQCYFRVM